MPLPTSNTSHRYLLPSLGFALLAALALPAFAAAEETRRVDRRFDAATVRVVELENLAGTIVLTGAAEPSVRVEATVHAEDSGGESAATLAGKLEVELTPSGDRLIVKAVYPVAEHRRYHYPGGPESAETEDSWLLSWLGSSSSTVRYQGRDVRVSSKAGSGAVTLWADFRLELPEGVAVKVKNSVGRIASSGVHGSQHLDTASGDIESLAGRGALVADTGSGDVAVRDHDGNASADTGSGDVHFENVRGATLAADTGSGDVHLLDCTGSLAADTGSGTIRGRGLVLGASAHADTGSGDVRLAGDFSAVRDLVVDTGSGDVVLDVAKAPSLHLVVSTGSGDIVVDLPGMKVRQSKGDFVADVGAADGRGRIDTGSGDVRVATY